MGLKTWFGYEIQLDGWGSGRARVSGVETGRVVVWW